MSTNVAPAKAFTYDSIGNILSKSDVGTYTYAPPGSPLPHAVTSISGSTISTTFTYDPNGNQTAGLGRTHRLDLLQQAREHHAGHDARSASCTTSITGASSKSPPTAPSSTSMPSASPAELSAAGTGAARWTDYLSVGNAKVGMRVLEVAARTVTTRYFHHDHLGSITVITNENGVVVERLRYDAWGKRRFPNGADDPTGSITSQTTRGFTGHEELDQVALVHMNGRVYDPLIGAHDQRRPDRARRDERPGAGTATPTSATTRSPSPIRAASRGCRTSSRASAAPSAR